MEGDGWPRYQEFNVSVQKVPSTTITCIELQHKLSSVVVPLAHLQNISNIYLNSSFNCHCTTWIILKTWSICIHGCACPLSSWTAVTMGHGFNLDFIPRIWRSHLSGEKFISKIPCWSHSLPTETQKVALSILFPGMCVHVGRFSMYLFVLFNIVRKNCFDCILIQWAKACQLKLRKPWQGVEVTLWTTTIFWQLYY